MQMLWISYAAVTSKAMIFYGVSETEILLLSMIFMVAYIPVTFLASWFIDKYDFKKGAGVGALVGGIFGFLRFLAGPNYVLALIFQTGIAIGQPFILNCITKLSANWFPESERTTSSGLSLMSQFVGIMLGVAFTPFLVVGNDLTIMLLVYGILSLASGILFVVLVKNRPPTPPSEKPSAEKVMMTEGFKQLFTNKNYLILLVIFFAGLGTFNFITTYIELIVIPRGYGSAEAGIFGAIIMIGAMIGAIIMGGLSDKLQKRKPLIIIATMITCFSLFMLAFTTNITLLYISGFLLGFGILSAGPVCLEYAVDITHPVPEATSNGLLMMIGQISGIIFILGFVNFTLPNGDYFPALILLAILSVVLVIASCVLKEKK